MEEDSLGYSAIGLPPGGVAYVLTTHGFAVRSVLGSTPIAKISMRKLSEVEERRAVRVARRKAEAERLRVLCCIREELSPSGEGTEPKFIEQQRLIESAAKAGFSRTMRGERRGQCTGCAVCTAFTRPSQLPPRSKFHEHCACCGCPASKHEEAKPDQKIQLY